MKRISIVLLFLVLTACSVSPDIAAQALPQIIETGVDSNTWAVIPAGEFPNGQHDHITDMNYDYQIMVTDVTNEQYAQFLNEAVADQSVSIGDIKAVSYTHLRAHET